MKTTSSNQLLLFIAAVSLLSFLASAADPDPLQDFCVAIINNTQIHVNGYTCKDPKTVTADDFLFSGGLHKRQEITNPTGFQVTAVFAEQFPGLNTLGLSHSRLDFAPDALDPPHVHPRSSETIFVMEGTLYAGFIATDNTLYAKILQAGDLFVFPRGLIHFQYNMGKSYASAFVSFNSQNPGVAAIMSGFIGSKPPVWDVVVAKALQVDQRTADYLQSLRWN